MQISKRKEGLHKDPHGGPKVPRPTNFFLFLITPRVN